MLLGILGKNPSGRFYYMLNLFDELDPDLFSVTILTDTETPFRKEEILQKGGRLQYIPPRKKDPRGHRAALKKVLSEGYSVCHIHLATASNTEIFSLAIRAKVPLVAAHSHSNQVEGGFVPKLLHRIGRQKLKRLPIMRFACSKAAGTFMFGNAPFSVLPNAIDLGRFQYREEKRAEIRSALSIGKDTFVVGHAGRLEPVKNHGFLLELLKEMKKREPDCKLLLLGEGSQREAIVTRAREMGLFEDVILAGNVDRPEDYYAAMDAFVLPSLFEGLSYVTLEAFATGLPCFAADTLPPEVRIHPDIRFFPLNISKEELAKEVLATKGMERKDRGEAIWAAGFDTESNRKRIKLLYFTAGNCGEPGEKHGTA